MATKKVKPKKSVKADKPDKKSKVTKEPKTSKKSKAPKVGKKSKADKLAKTGKKSKKVAAPKAVAFSPDYGDILDTVERRFKISNNLNDRFKWSFTSGSLVVDMMLGGGYVAGGMYTMAGGEQSAKSTTIMNFLARCVQMPEEKQPRVIMYYDAEGSFDQGYFGNMVGAKKKSQISLLFGTRDNKGKWIGAPPRIRYYPEGRGEATLQAINSFLKKLPDMEQLDDRWWYVYENTKDNRAASKGEYDKGLFSKYNKFYLPVETYAPQAVIVVDSWPSLIPERMDDEDSGSGLGAAARMFAENLPMVKGKCRRKNVILMGVNQLRDKPMAMGDPRYEPGGNALKFLSDVRIWNTSRVIPKDLMGSSVSGQVHEEPSVSGSGVDHYRYVHLQPKKNKLSTPGIQGWMRVWVSDENGEGRGIDQAFDVFYFLRMTGQLTGNARKLVVEMDKGHVKFKGTMLDIKRLVLSTGTDRDKAFKKLGMKKSTDLWKYCRRQIESGRAKELMVEHNKRKAAAKGDDEDDE